jgi:hypothetical protein
MMMYKTAEYRCSVQAFNDLVENNNKVKTHKNLKQ